MAATARFTWPTELVLDFFSVLCFAWKHFLQIRDTEQMLATFWKSPNITCEIQGC